MVAVQSALSKHVQGTGSPALKVDSALYLGETGISILA